MPAFLKRERKRERECVVLIVDRQLHVLFRAQEEKENLNNAGNLSRERLVECEETVRNLRNELQQKDTLIATLTAQKAASDQQVVLLSDQLNEVRVPRRGEREAGGKENEEVHFASTVQCGPGHDMCLRCVLVDARHCRGLRSWKLPTKNVKKTCAYAKGTSSSSVT